MNNPIDLIKQKVDIVEFISSYITLSKAGRNFKANCPFHQEQTPSFIVSPDRQIWRCFGACQEGGDVISFLMKWESITFFEALKELSEKTGVKIENIDFEDKEYLLKKRLIDLNTLTCKLFRHILLHTEGGKKCMNYLLDRKLNQKIINTFELGFTPKNQKTLYNFLIKRGFSQQEIIQSGLVIKTYSGYIDRFKERLMFPIKDLRGNIIGFSGRIIDEPTQTSGLAKYINTPETPTYHKRETLFGVHLSRSHIVEKDSVLVVEGEFDMIACFQNGIDNVVAIKGTAFTKEQLLLLRRFTKNIIMSLDSDAAGAETVKRIVSETQDTDFHFSVITIDFAKDPDEALKINPIKFKKILENPIPIYDFLIDLEFNKHDGSSVYDKAEIAEDLIPLITNIKNPIIEEHYKKKLSQLIDSSVESINNLIMLFKQKKKKLKPDTTNFKVNQSDSIEKHIIAFMLQNEIEKSIFDKIFEIIQSTDFSTPALAELYDEIKRYIDIENKLVLSSFIPTLKIHLQKTVDDLLLLSFPEIEEDNFKYILKSTLNLKRLILKDQIRFIGKSDESENNQKKLSKLSSQLASIENKLIVM